MDVVSKVQWWPSVASNVPSGLADDEGTTGVYRGANPSEGALFSFWVEECAGEPVKIDGHPLRQRDGGEADVATGIETREA